MKRTILTLVFLFGVFTPVFAAPLVSMEGGSKKSENVQIASAASETPSESEYHCEVMSINGVAYLTNRKVDHQPLKQGDLLKVNDVIEVGGGWVDIAFDSRWKNVTRVEGDSKFTVRALFPTGLTLVKGAIYARLKELPEGSSFEIKTPTAVATVRGTEFRTSVDAEGKTEIASFSDSPVYVIGVDLQGAPAAKEPTVLKNSELTQVARRGFAPIQPRRMTTTEIAVCRQAQSAIETRVGELNREGKVGKIQDIDKVKKEIAARLEKKKPAGRDDRKVPGGPGGPGGPGSGKPDGGESGSGNFGGGNRNMGEHYQIGASGERMPVGAFIPQNPDLLDRPAVTERKIPAEMLPGTAPAPTETSALKPQTATFAPQPATFAPPLGTFEPQPVNTQVFSPSGVPTTTGITQTQTATVADQPVPPPPPKTRQENT